MNIESTIDKLDKALCSGCGACENICPKNAIHMEYNNEGFHEPVIDTDLCVSCGLCEKACPALHPKKDNDKNPSAYTVKGTPKILKESTSGGVFAVLAEYIISKNGYVCGAAYNDEFEVWHTIANTTEGVRKIKKSKYVQSQMGLIYRDIKKLLMEEQWVLFCGAPCQVAALHNYLGKSYDKLYTVDIICHGAPAPMSWKKYLQENIDISKLKAVDFRHKGNHGFKKHHIAFEYKNGKMDIQPSSKNPYFFHFSKNLGLRRSCASCQGAVFPRVGDFSAGDFWGANICYPELVKNDSGISIMFMNNNHARELKPYLESKFDLMKEITPKAAMTSNRKNVSRKMNPNRERFFNMLQENTFNEAVRKNIGTPFDIAIYGNTLGSNYGGLITYYALYKALLNAGYSVVMLRRPIKKEKGVVDHGTRFCEENIILSDEKPFEKFGEYNKLANTFILGSDQVWNYELFSGRKLTLYFDFVDDTKKKIAYAASYGFDVPTIFPDNKSLHPIITSLMKRFDSIAVREADAVGITDKYFNAKAKHVMDPVFLLPAKEYEILAERATRKPEGDYMTVYALSPGKKINKALIHGAEMLNLPRVNMGPGNETKWKRKTQNADMPYIENIQLEEWLYNIKNAKFVMTDSYHCVCFSIIFRKNFVLIQKTWAVSRIESLLEKLNLKDRWFENVAQLKEHPEVFTTDIDYDAVYEILDKEIDDSLAWLKNAIEAEKKVKVSDVLDDTDRLPFAYKSLRKTTDANKYFKKVGNEKLELIAVFAVSGKDSSKIKENSLMQSIQYSRKNYAGIYDVSGKILKKKKKAFGRTEYAIDGVDITVAAEALETGNEVRHTEISVETNGKRHIYECKNNGLHVLLYSKKLGRVVDFSRIDKAGNIIHLKK